MKVELMTNYHFPTFKCLIWCFTIGAIILSACQKYEEPVPNRPAKVPEEAVWVGGVDGGDWILCQPIHNKVYECTIFTEDGIKISKGQYTFKGKVDDPKLNFEAHDGEIIYLNNGKLIPVGKQTHFSATDNKKTWIVDHSEMKKEKSSIDTKEK